MRCWAALGRYVNTVPLQNDDDDDDGHDYVNAPKLAFGGGGGDYVNAPKLASGGGGGEDGHR